MISDGILTVANNDARIGHGVDVTFAETGYDGAGTTVAIIDTGLDGITQVWMTKTTTRIHRPKDPRIL